MFWSNHIKTNVEFIKFCRSISFLELQPKYCVFSSTLLINYGFHTYKNQYSKVCLLSFLILEISQILCTILLEFISRKFFNTGTKSSLCMLYFFLADFFLILFHRISWYSSFDSSTSIYNTIFPAFESTTIFPASLIAFSFKYPLTVLPICLASPT